jgi:uncharacterized cupredoxin-like copper-binding protein
MGGMFSVVKVREGLAAEDYKDPGHYKNPEGTVAYLFKGDPGPAPSAPANGSSREPAAEFNVVKPKANSSSHQH